MDTKHRRYHKDETSGIDVTIENITENRYEATVNIPVCILKCESLRLNNHHFSISITPKVPPDELLDDIVTIRIRRGYSRGGMGLIKDRNVSLKFDEATVSGELVLKPKFYILPEERFTKQNLKRKSKEKRERRHQAEQEQSTSLVSKLNPFKSTSKTNS